MTALRGPASLLAVALLFSGCGDLPEQIDPEVDAPMATSEPTDPEASPTRRESIITQVESVIVVGRTPRSGTGTFTGVSGGDCDQTFTSTMRFETDVDGNPQLFQSFEGGAGAQRTAGIRLPDSVVTAGGSRESTYVEFYVLGGPGGDGALLDQDVVRGVNVSGSPDLLPNLDPKAPEQLARVLLEAGASATAGDLELTVIEILTAADAEDRSELCIFEVEIVLDAP